MPRSRLVIAGTLLLVLVALAIPAVGTAGGSAGDQQYTDPFAGGGGSATHTAATTTSSPATTTSPSASPQTPGAAPSSVPAASKSSADPTSTPTASATDPTATIAGGEAPSLPYTGYDAWAAVGCGLTLVAGGSVLRWRLRSRRC